MDVSTVKMTGYIGENGKYVKGIEDYLSRSQYERIEHQKMVVNDILENWVRLSHNGKFHGIFATSRISDAIDYYRLIKKAKPELKITALFDPNIDNNGGVLFKADGLVEIIEDYNKCYEQDFTLANHGKMKKDIASRLAHKEPYTRIERTPEKQIDVLIVVDQMLTGFDSKWVNTLYMDKLLKYENIIQAFSRTNRLFGPEKPFGTIRYYRLPHTMEENINKAVKLYSGDKPIGLFVQQLEYNLKKMNGIYEEIHELFSRANILNFEKSPTDSSECGKFAKLFKALNTYLEAAKIQGFKWGQSVYEFSNGKGKPKTVTEMTFDENTYLILALRYKELFGGGESGVSEDVPFEIDGYLTEIDTGVIDAEFMNSRFDKYLKMLNQDGIDKDQIQQTLDDLHKSFATLTQEEQKYANIFLHDVQSGNATMASGKTFRDYVTEYQSKAKNDQIHTLSFFLGLDETKLRNMMNSGITESNINEFGRFDDLKNTVDKNEAKMYFEKLEGAKIPLFKINVRVHKLLKKFVISGGMEVELPDGNFVYDDVIIKESKVAEKSEKY
jgi:type I restriction enzyme R subunit